MTASPTASAEPLLAARRIGVVMGGASILHSVSIDVLPGRIVTLIGPNGSGKTTLVRALLGLVPVTEGAVLRIAKRVSYVPQSFTRDRSMPLSALQFTASLGGATEGAALTALERTGAAHAASRQLSALSGGEMARVALARAILRKPDVLVLDEPLAGVDVAGEASLYELIASLRDEMGTAVLLVSHDLHVVMAAADHVVCLNHHVCCEGDASFVARDPAFIALFGRRVAEQIALYEHRHDHVHG